MPTHPRPRPRALLENLESRMLLSAAPAWPALQQPSHAYAATFPAETTLNTPRFTDLWHLHNTGQNLSTSQFGPNAGIPDADIDAPEAWDLTTGSNDVIVAVLDTGIDLNHEDLAANIFANPYEVPNNGIDDDGNGFVDDYRGWNFYNNNNNVQDNDIASHGTMVSGVIGAVGNNGKGISGVAWNVTILPIKVSNSVNPFEVTSDNVARAIDYVIGLRQRGFDIIAINASYSSVNIPNLNEINAIHRAGDNGILYINAAGNGGLNLDPLTFGFSVPNMITVAATNNQDQLWSQSNYGNSFVKLAAPGVDILTTFRNNAYAVQTGTSFAAPMVSGAAALLAAWSPEATSTQIRDAILDSVDVKSSLIGKVATAGRLNVYKALQELVGNQAPFGYVDVANTSAISGWGYDFNAGVNPVEVDIYVNDQYYSTVIANAQRNDLVPVVGSANHGFYAPLNLPFGTSKVDVYLVDNPANTLTSIGSFSLTKNAPSGVVDAVSAAGVSGWVFDLDAATSPVDVHVYVNDTLAAAVTANGNRPDLTPVIGSPNHGFNIPLSLPTGSSTVKVYFIDKPTNQGVLAGTYTVKNTVPIGFIDVANATTISGWVGDTDTPALPAYVRIDIDGAAGTPFLASQNRPDLASLFAGNTNHGFSFTPPTLTPGYHRADIWVFDTVTGAGYLMGSRTLNTHIAPVGYVDILNSTKVMGWAYDPNTPADAINVRIDINGVPRTVLANINRSDLTPVIGSPNHAFSWSLPALTPGNHKIDVYAVDAQNFALTTLASKTLTITEGADRRPVGYIDILNTNIVAGWAYDPDSPVAAINVRVDVDGVMGTPFTASLNRPDLTPVIGSPSHGFAFTMPGLTPGAHRVDVYFYNFNDNTPVLRTTAIIDNAVPAGYVDIFNATTIAGWGYDPDNPTASIYVRLDVDNTPGPVFLAGNNRPDLVPVVGSPNHGFSFATPALSQGKHTLAIRLIDPFTYSTTTIAQSEFTYP